MTRSAVIVAAIVVALVLLPSIVEAIIHPDDTTTYQLGSAPPPTYPVGFEPIDNVPTRAPGIATTTTLAKRRHATVHAAGASVWDALARCESHGNWSINTGNGYSGGLQMDAQFWATYGGHAFAPAPWQATREQQIVVAERGRAARGYTPWPTCARKIGLLA